VLRLLFCLLLALPTFAEVQNKGIGEGIGGTGKTLHDPEGLGGTGVNPEIEMQRPELLELEIERPEALELERPDFESFDRADINVGREEVLDNAEPPAAADDH